MTFCLCGHHAGSHSRLRFNCLATSDQNLRCSCRKFEAASDPEYLRGWNDCMKWLEQVDADATLGIERMGERRTLDVLLNEFTYAVECWPDGLPRARAALREEVAYYADLHKNALAAVRDAWDRIATLSDVLNDALRFADNVAHRAASEGEEDSDAIILGDRIRAALARRSA